MHIEEFKAKLNLKYTFGMNGTTGASRRYHDSEMNIGSEVHTPKDKHGKWGKGEKLYYFEDDRRTFDSIEELHSAYLKKANN